MLELSRNSLLDDQTLEAVDLAEQAGPTEPNLGKIAAPSLPTCSTREQKLFQVHKWILAGVTVYEIREAISKYFPEDDASALIVETMRGIETAGSFDPAVVRGWCFEAARDLYRRMVEIGDFPGALRAVKQIAEMTRHVSDDPTTEDPEATAIDGSLPAGEAGRGGEEQS